VDKLDRFRVVYEEEVSEFIGVQTKRLRRRLMDIAYAIADKPSAELDYFFARRRRPPDCACCYRRIRVWLLGGRSGETGCDR
jgi:hypothetical protein